MCIDMVRYMWRENRRVLLLAAILDETITEKTESKLAMREDLVQFIHEHIAQVFNKSRKYLLFFFSILFFINRFRALREDTFKDKANPLCG
jgi:hypothetical protein